jgi:haloalkane dehalogenase
LASLSETERAEVREAAMAIRPAWVDQELFPFGSHFVEVEGARVLYIDEDQGTSLVRR